MKNACRIAGDIPATNRALRLEYRGNPKPVPHPVLLTRQTKTGSEADHKLTYTAINVVIELLREINFAGRVVRAYVPSKYKLLIFFLGFSQLVLTLSCKNLHAASIISKWIFLGWASSKFCKTG
jgi:hypothetical protein